MSARYVNVDGREVLVPEGSRLDVRVVPIERRETEVTSGRFRTVETRVEHIEREEVWRMTSAEIQELQEHLSMSLSKATDPDMTFDAVKQAVDGNEVLAKAIVSRTNERVMGGPGKVTRITVLTDKGFQVGFRIEEIAMKGDFQPK